MMISISIPEVKGIIHEYISRHYRLLEPEKDIEKTVSLVEYGWSSVSDDDAACLSFTADVVLAGTETE